MTTTRAHRAAPTTPAAQAKSRLAYDFIRQRIENGDYTPGYRLVLAPIAAELGVSVVPVREAIRMLEAEGLVHFQRNIGAQVAMVDPREYEVTMQTLSLVEGWATAASAPFMTAADIARARAINEAMERSLSDLDPVEFTRLNLDFHTVIFEHCPNPHVRELVDRGWARLRALRQSVFTFVPGRARESVAEHERILRLIETGAEALELELAARNHRLATLEAFLEHRKADAGFDTPATRATQPAVTHEETA